MKDEDIQKFMDDNDELFRNLATKLWCPFCQKGKLPPFLNFGVHFNSAEGCKECYEALEK